MAAHTEDRNDPRLGRGIDLKPIEQNEAYLILSAEERAKGFVRPVRDSYRHEKCSVLAGAVTTMSMPLAETYARCPEFYGSTYCCACRMHKDVGEFTWTKDGQVVGS